MEKTIKNFLKLKLHLSYFFNSSFSKNQVRLIGYYNEKVERHILEKGFVKADDVHQDDEDMIEYAKDNVKIVLSVK